MSSRLLASCTGLLVLTSVYGVTASILPRSGRPTHGALLRVERYASGHRVDVDDDVGDLQRFVAAQDDGGTYEDALAELRAGRKRSHWMWFVFPQLAGLGRSATAQHYALRGLVQARAYLAHPVLGPRLRTCVEALLRSGQHDPVAVLGPVDAQKLRSSMTLFALAEPSELAFQQVLASFFDGRPDDTTTGLLAGDR